MNGNICALCPAPAASRHHLVPASKGGTVTVPLCDMCHRQIHALYENSAIDCHLDTLEKLRADPRMATWLAWRARHPDATVKIRERRRRWQR